MLGNYNVNIWQCSPEAFLAGKRIPKKQTQSLRHPTNSSAWARTWLTHTNENDVAVASRRPPLGIKVPQRISGIFYDFLGIPRFLGLCSCVPLVSYELHSRRSVWVHVGPISFHNNIPSCDLKARCRMTHLKLSNMRIWSGFWGCPTWTKNDKDDNSNRNVAPLPF